MSSSRARRARLLAAAAVLALTATAGPAPAEARAYAFTRGSSFATGNHELLVPTLTLPKGTELVFVNLHVWGHSIFSDAWAVEGERRLFRSDVVPFGETSIVRGVGELDRGEYGFFCSNHMGMRGTIVIV